MSKIYYLCPDFERPSSGTRELYWHVWQLRQQGMEAWIVHQKDGFRLTWHGIDVPIMSLGDSPGLAPTDVVVLPDMMGSILKQLSTASVTVNKVVLAMNWHPNRWQLAHRNDWGDHGVQAVLTPSKVIADYVRWQMELPTTVMPSYVDPKKYFYDASLKQPVVAYMSRKSSDAATLQGILAAKTGDLRKFRWQAMVNMAEVDYAQQLRVSNIYLASSSQEGLNISVLEAMASGCLVVGYHGIGGGEFMVGEGEHQNCILIENGNLPAFGIALEQVLINYHNHPHQYDKVVNNAIATAHSYQDRDQQAKLLVDFYRSFLPPQSSTTVSLDTSVSPDAETITDVPVEISHEENIEIAPEQTLSLLTGNHSELTPLMVNQPNNNGQHAEEEITNTLIVDDTIADDTIADDTIADDTIADDTIADDTIADDTIADDTIADDTIADEAIADEPAMVEHIKSNERLETVASEMGNGTPSTVVSLETPLETAKSKKKLSQSSASRSGRGFGKVTPPRKGAKGKSKGKKSTVDVIPNLVQKATQLRRDGQLENAQSLYKQAFEIDRTIPELWFNYGNLLQQMGQPLDAEETFRQAIALRPEFFQAHLNLANLLRDRHQVEAAITHYHKVIQFEPQFFLAYHNLGQLLMSQGRSTEAVGVFMEWAQADQKNPVPLNGLGIVLQSQGRYNDAIRLFEQALALAPERSDSLNNLGTLLRMLHRPHDALPYLRQAIAQGPISDTTLTNLVHTLLNLGHVGEALSQTAQVLEQHPNSASGHLMRGFALTQLAQNKTAMVSFQKTWDLEHKATIAVSNALFTLLYRDDLSNVDCASERQQWIDRLPQPAKIYGEWQGDRCPHRQLKVGYLSADLRSHPVSFFLEPILSHHNHEQIEVYCYDTGGIEDDVTKWLKGDSDHWCTCAGWTDEALAQRIYNDGLDILVDLSGHTAGNRSGVIQYKPAPIQILYIGYPGSTGLTQMDYILANDFVIPSHCESLYTEKVLRVDGSFWCYQPHPAAPSPNPLPALDNGYITFGSFNHTPKLSEPTIQLWSQLLAAIPTARLKLKALSLGDEEACAHFRRQFAQQGGDVDRIIFEGPTMQVEQFFQSYHAVDIALDPTPYNGGTTTCEALWMGVPVITLQGQRFCSRMGHSLLHSVGLEDLSAETTTEYVAIAVALAADLERLQIIRQTLRSTMNASPLCDGALATQQLEEAYRQAWQQFCQSPM